MRPLGDRGEIQPPIERPHRAGLGIGAERQRQNVPAPATSSFIHGKSLKEGMSIHVPAEASEPTTSV